MKADKSYVDTQLGTKVNTSTYNDAITLKANKTYVATQLAGKANSNVLAGYVRYGDGVSIAGDWRSINNASSNRSCGVYCRAVKEAKFNNVGHQKGGNLAKFLFIKN